MRVVLSFLIHGLSLVAVEAQSHFKNEWTEKLDLFTTNYSLLNPAICATDAPRELLMSYKGHAGIFAGIRSYYLQLNADLATNLRDSIFRRNKQVLGLTALGDREGEFITKSRVGLQYAFHTPIFSSWSLSAGVNASLVSYSFQSSTASAGGSANKLSGTIGICAYNRNHRLGINISDFNNPTLQPLGQTFTLQRSGMVYAEKEIAFNHEVDLTLSSAVYSETLKAFRAMGATVLEYRKKGGGIMYSQYNGTSVLVSLRDLGKHRNRFSLTGSCKLPLSKIATLRQTSFEVNVCYKILAL